MYGRRLTSEERVSIARESFLRMVKKSLTEHIDRGFPIGGMHNEDRNVINRMVTEMAESLAQSICNKFLEEASENKS